MYLFASFISLTFISNSICNINLSGVMFLLPVTPLQFCTPSPAFASFNILSTLPLLCLLGDALPWRRFLLATPASGDACSWRRVCLATPVAYFESVFHLFSPWPCAWSGKKMKTEANLFLNFFFFYLGDLVKKPPRGKKSVPYNKIVTWLFTYIVQLK